MYIHIAVPDFSHLDPKLVQLLAVQRLQELFTELTNQRAVSSNPPNKDGLQTNASDDRKQEHKSKSLREQEEHLLNGLRQCIRPPTLWHLRHTNGKLDECIQVHNLNRQERVGHNSDSCCH